MATKNKEKSTATEQGTVENIEVAVVEKYEDVAAAHAKELLSKINESMGDVGGDNSPPAPVASRKSSFSPTDEIPCKSLFLGKMIYTSPTNGARYIWGDFNTVVYIPFGELQTMNNHKPNFLNKPLLLIENPDAVAYFNLMPVYEKVANINGLEALFATGNISLIRTKIRESIDVGMRDAIISKVRKMVTENLLTNIHIIKALKEELKFDIV